MLNIIRLAFWALVAICLVVVGIANRDMVTLRAMPEGVANLVGVSPDVQLPLFVVILIGVIAGLLIGFVWEYLREYKFRAAARQNAREVRKLETEVDRMRTEKHEGKDEVLALLESTPAR